MAIPTTVHSDPNEFDSSSRRRRTTTRSQSRWQEQQHISNNIPTSRTNNLSTPMYLEVKHKTIRIPAVHSNKDEDDYDGDYIRRTLGQEYNRSSTRSLDRSEASSRNRKSRSCSTGRQSRTCELDHSAPKTSVRRMKKSNSSRKEVTLSRSKSSQMYQHPLSPVSLTETTRSTSSNNSLSYSNKSNGSSIGRKAPERRGIQRTFSSRVEADDSPSTSSISKSNNSYCSHYSSNCNRSPTRRLRRARSLDASTRSLPREDYVLTRSSSNKKYIDDFSESEISLSDITNHSSSNSTSMSSQPLSSGSNHSLRRFGNQVTKRKLKKTRSNDSVLSGCSGNTDISSSSGNTKLTSGTNSIDSITIGHESPSRMDASSKTVSTTTSTLTSGSDGLKRVSWKTDPKLGFSDWTLHVVYRDSRNKRQVDVYHLHKNIVAYGNRKSSYLLRDIMDGELKEVFDSSNETELEIKKLLDTGKSANKSKRDKNPSLTVLKLPNEAQAATVPLVLDFMYYSTETNHQMSADRSCNVFKVAEGLKVRALQTAIGKFYEANLSVKNMEQFLQAATNTRANMLLAICKAKIRQMVTAKPELADMVPEEYISDILDNLSDKSSRSTSKKKKPPSGTLRKDHSFTTLVAMGVK